MTATPSILDRIRQLVDDRTMLPSDHADNDRRDRAIESAVAWFSALRPPMGDADLHTLDDSRCTISPLFHAALADHAAAILLDGVAAQLAADRDPGLPTAGGTPTTPRSAQYGKRAAVLRQAAQDAVGVRSGQVKPASARVNFNPTPPGGHVDPAKNDAGRNGAGTNGGAA